MPHAVAFRFGVFVALLAVMLAWERLAPATDIPGPRTARWLGNFGIAAIGAVIASALAPFVPVGVALIAQARSFGLLHDLALPGWLKDVIAFFVLDLAIYLQHRVFHAVPLLWRLHRMHHADVALDATTGVRFHPIEIVLSLAIKVGVVLALGAPPIAVLAFEIVLNAAAIFNHANVRLPARFDQLLRVVLVTPAMHRIHHSIVRAETDSNFGFSVPWWDRLFGTYRARAAAGDAMTIGLSIFREPEASHLDRLLVQPFREPMDR